MKKVTFECNKCKKEIEVEEKHFHIYCPEKWLRYELTSHETNHKEYFYICDICCTELDLYPEDKYDHKDVRDRLHDVIVDIVTTYGLEV